MDREEAHLQKNPSVINESPKGTINSGGTSYTNYEDLNRSSSLKISRKDFLRQLAWKIKQSQILLLFYFIAIMTNGILLWLSYRKEDSHWIFTVIEVLLNCIYVLEIVVEILTDVSYFSKCCNYVDIIICLACWVLLAVYLWESRRIKHQDIESEIDVDLLSARYVVQTIRISRYLKTAYIGRRYLKQDDVKFDPATSQMLSELLV